MEKGEPLLGDGRDGRLSRQQQMHHKLMSRKSVAEAVKLGGNGSVLKFADLISKVW